MKTVLFGGGFDPPHLGHERALKNLLSHLSPDRVVVLPAGTPPHKDLSGGADGEGRMAMCRAAFADEGVNVVFSDYDLKQAGKCYSYHALMHFQKEDPNGVIFLYVGTDQLLAFETWYRFEDILKSAHLAVMSRDGDRASLEKKKEQLERDYNARVILLEEEPIVISSAEIRREIGSRGFSDFVSPGVNEIITRHGFYGSRLNERRGAVLDRIAAALDGERMTHTLGMERETVRLAAILDYPADKIRLAALLHDLTRRWRDEDQIAFLRDVGERITPDDEATPVVLHGRSAAVIAEREFGLDPVLCDAIRYHTTGREKMTLPDKILFYADFIEDTRRHAVCQQARRLFYAGLPEGKNERLEYLDESIVANLKSTVSHLRQKNVPVHPLTLAALKGLTNDQKA